MSLTSSPGLPATSLANFCYNGMFEDCKKLSDIKVGFGSWDGAANVTADWLKYAGTDPSVGRRTFRCPSSLDTTVRDGSHVPSGWSVVNE